ncbi:MAG: hypothetical protein DM484_20915 [Candidatus Methylumidiphilus alinenensis]|uniref:Uncharacterized protein n=1 Tax=Candidatus Methylumidiphilus alinenensis TaxID=2202197 RepID=A0A2W4QR19_9GAMM|nr:MAG: hypothetical protein DM484_20915 [Candidatus Methylumidiphilus alinenensis]
MIFGLGVWQIVDAKETIALAHDILTTSCLSQAFSATFNKTNALSEWLALAPPFAKGGTILIGDEKKSEASLRETFPTLELVVSSP